MTVVSAEQLAFQDPHIARLGAKDYKLRPVPSVVSSQRCYSTKMQKRLLSMKAALVTHGRPQYSAKYGRKVIIGTQHAHSPIYHNVYIEWQ